MKLLHGSLPRGNRRNFYQSASQLLTVLFIPMNLLEKPMAYKGSIAQNTSEEELE